MTDVMWERVMLIYRLMKGLPVNAGDILRQNMFKLRINKRWCFCYGSIIPTYMRSLMIEEEVHYVCPPLAPYLVCQQVNFTCTKAHKLSHGPVLSTIDRQLVMIVGWGTWLAWLNCN